MKKFLVFICFSGLLVGCKKNTQDTVDIDLPDPYVPAADTVTTSTANFKGVNWADPRDNFADDQLILSGLEVTDNEDVVLDKAETILSAFQVEGVNTIRLPINPSTVLQSWWPKYASIISKASSKGIKVILAYWEGSSSKDGRIDNSTAYWLMWDKVVAKYSNNQNVYFEVFNEPHGYSLGDLKELYVQWIATYSISSRRRILLDGGGYATDVNAIGADSRFDSCLLSFHFYPWFNDNYKTTADWELPVKTLSYPGRTVTTEFGVPMTAGKDYEGAPAVDKEVNYMQGFSSQLHDRGVGSVYWPGLRTGDSYSMFSYNGSSVSSNSISGLARLKYAWGTGNVDPFYAEFPAGSYYKVINKNSAKAMDVSGSSINDGGDVIQWDYSGGNNQQWSFTTLGNGYYGIINKNSGKSLDINGASSNAGTRVIQWGYSGANNQQWMITNIGFGFYKIINRNSEQALDVNAGSTSNGGSIIQWHWNNGNNQQWEITVL